MVYQLFGENDFNLIFYGKPNVAHGLLTRHCDLAGSTLAPFLTFIISNALLTFLDLTGKPAFLLKYKIQEEKHVPVSHNEGQQGTSIYAETGTALSAHVVLSVS